MRLSAEVVKVLTDMDDMDKASQQELLTSEVAVTFVTIFRDCLMCNVHVQDNISSASS